MSLHEIDLACKVSDKIVCVKGDRIAACGKPEGIFSELNGLLCRGYQIHMGQSDRTATVVQNGNVFGRYIHGIFDENGIAQTIIRALCGRRGITFDENAVFDVHAYRESQYDQLADAVRGALDMEMIDRIIEEGI